MWADDLRHLTAQKQQQAVRLCALGGQMFAHPLSAAALLSVSSTYWSTKSQRPWINTAPSTCSALYLDSRGKCQTSSGDTGFANAVLVAWYG